VLDRERVNRKRLGPRAVEERVQQAAPAVADPFDLASLDGDGPGLVAWTFIAYLLSW
jgi:hypothetical protein